MRVERFPNPNIVEVHVRTRLAENPAYFRVKGWRLDYEADNNILLRAIRVVLRAQRAFQKDQDEMHRLSPFVDALFEVEGLVEVSVHQYSLRISKGGDFSWEEIIPEVEQVLKRFCFSD